MSKRDLRKSVIVITGASAGIGAATAVEAGRAGMRVVLAARRREKLEIVAAQVRKLEAEALVVPTDVTDDEQVRRLIDRTREVFGQVDALFANAGAGHFDEAVGADPDPEAERWLWQLNYDSVLRCVRAAARVMRERGEGHILVNCSVLSFTGLACYSTYCATKAAAHALTVSLMLELESEGIDVTGVYPSGTRTEFFRQLAQRRGVDLIGESAPEFFMQSPEHVARRIVACLRKPRPEVWPSRLMHLGVALWVMFPRFRRICLRSHARPLLQRFRSLQDKPDAS